ncbi:MAG: hypothetical protein NC548_20085 [Lachnospiraceae bacterium]|nr:hypothetical protein [Lachnospiraceae bacterium]
MKNPNLADLDKLADEILAKSNKSEPVEPEPAPAPKPDEIAQPSPAATPAPNEDEGEGKKSAPVKPDEGEEPAPAAAPAPTEPPKGDEDGDEGPDKKGLEKSIQSEFKGLEDIQKGMDASEFLTSVVEILSKSLADVVFELQVNGQDNQTSTTTLAKSLAASLRLNQDMAAQLEAMKAENDSLKKSISDGFEELTQMLSDVLSQPATVRKSVGNINVHQRNFNQSLNGGGNDGFESLSKAQVMDVLNAELFKGNPVVQASDIIGYESGAPLRNEVRTLVMNTLRA